MERPREKSDGLRRGFSGSVPEAEMDTQACFKMRDLNGTERETGTRTL